MPIPIYDANGRLLRFADAEIVIAHRFHFRLVVTNKGRRRAIPLPHQVKEAHVRAIESLDVRPTSNLGMAFEQCLSTGHVYALRGVRGSK